MKIKDMAKRYRISDMWCEAGSEERAYVTESERIGKISVLRGMSKHGSHVTLRTGEICYMTEEEYDECARVASGEIMRMAKPSLYRMRDKDRTVLAFCIGNRNITSDAQAPLCAELLDATFHLKENAPELYSFMGGYRLAVISPGTEGQCGVQPSDMLSCVCKRIKPDVIIAIDALAAGSDEYIGRSVQISSAGITPGKGTGNEKKRISCEDTGTFTVGIGIPTVISSSTLIYNALEKAEAEDISPEIYDILENNRSFYVSPKNIDQVTHSASEILSRTVRSFCDMLSRA